MIPQLDLAREVPVASKLAAGAVSPTRLRRSLDMSGDELAQPTAVFKPLTERPRTPA